MAVSVVMTNCIGSGGTTDFANTGAYTITRTYCISTDATADDEGGAGNQVSKTAASLFVAPSSGNFRLKKGSAAIRAGVAISGLTADMLGSAWTNPPDVGALAYTTVGGGATSGGAAVPSRGNTPALLP